MAQVIIVNAYRIDRRIKSPAVSRGVLVQNIDQVVPVTDTQVTPWVYSKITFKAGSLPQEMSVIETVAELKALIEAT